MSTLPAEARRTVETVIRDESLRFSDLLLARGLMEQAAAFHWHSEPELGFYCLYRARPDDPSPAVPDCAGIERTTRTHAAELHAAGIDFVFADLTNLPEANPFADLLGLRPLEVLFESWGALRASGLPTPDIAPWVPATEAQGAANPLFRRVLDAMETPNAPFLVFAEDGPGRRALHRCLKADGGHLLSLDAGCEGMVREDLLGWVASARTSETPRALRRCYRSDAGRHGHELDGTCAGREDEGILGYVR